MKIAIIQTRSGIGDMCIFLPAVHFIAKNYNTKVTLITSKRSKSKDFLFQDHLIEDIIYYDEKNNFKSFRLLKTLFLKKFSKVFIMHFSLRYFLISILSLSKKTFFYGILKNSENISSYLNKKISIWLKKDNLELPCKIFFKTEHNNNNNIIIGIGGSGLTKKWPVENYINLLKQINEYNNKLKFIIAGGIEEESDKNIILDNIKNTSIISLCDKSLKESIKYLPGSKLYVGNDTGFMHLCGSLGVRAFGLFGDTPINYTDYNFLINPIIPDGYETISHNDRAIKKISVSKVFQSIKNFI